MCSYVCLSFSVCPYVCHVCDRHHACRRPASRHATLAWPRRPWAQWSPSAEYRWEPGEPSGVTCLRFMPCTGARNQGESKIHFVVYTNFIFFLFFFLSLFLLPFLPTHSHTYHECHFSYYDFFFFCSNFNFNFVSSMLHGCLHFFRLSFYVAVSSLLRMLQKIFFLGSFSVYVFSALVLFWMGSFLQNIQNFINDWFIFKWKFVTFLNWKLLTWFGHYKNN